MSIGKFHRYAACWYDAEQALWTVGVSEHVATLLLYSLVRAYGKDEEAFEAARVAPDWELLRVQNFGSASLTAWRSIGKLSFIDA